MKQKQSNEHKIIRAPHAARACYPELQRRIFYTANNSNYIPRFRRYLPALEADGPGMRLEAIT